MSGRDESLAREGERAGLQTVYYQQHRKQGTLAYDGASLRPTIYYDEGLEARSCVVYEYITYDEPFAGREVIFHVPRSMLQQ